MRLRRALRRLHLVWRQLNGDTAYERYLAHWREAHARTEQKPMTRKAFYRAELERRWSGIARCC